MRHSRILGWATVGCALGLIVAAGVLAALSGDDAEALPVVIASVFAILGSLAVGILIWLRVPGNALGPLLIVNAALLAWVAFVGSWADYAIRADPGALPAGEWAVAFDNSDWPLLFVGIVGVAYLFPDGRLPSRRWRPIALVTAACLAVMTVLAPFSPEGFETPFEHVHNPIPSLPSSIYGAVSGIALLGMAAGLVGGALALRARFVRGSAIERLQVKWLALAGGLFPVALIANVIDAVINGQVGVTGIVLLLALLAIPAAIGVAVLRYRLYEVDRLISRAISYTVLSALLALAYAAVAIGLGVLAGAGSTLPTAAATLAVVFAFRPVRARVQAVVDRRFDRERYTAERAVDEFVDELRAGKAAPEATGEMLAAALGDPSARLFFRLPDSDSYADAAGREIEGLPASPAGRTPVRRGDLDLGVLLHDEQLSQRPNLLDGVLVRAGLAIEIARLRVAVRRQLAEVERSRARLVAATDEERRRLERDLHDGAQQRLVSIGLALRHIQHVNGSDGVAVADSLDGVVDDLGEAIESLRELAHGVRPAALDGGLAPALDELASGAAMETDVDATSERFDPSLEAAAFFVASEGLANSIKHSGATRVGLTASRSNSTLVMCVSDDGVGGADLAGGSGLAGLADRVTALGGKLELRSESGAGTTLTAELPCG